MEQIQANLATIAQLLWKIQVRNQIENENPKASLPVGDSQENRNYSTKKLERMTLPKTLDRNLTFAYTYFYETSLCPGKHRVTV